MSINQIIVAVASIALIACGTTSSVSEKNTEPGEKNIETTIDNDLIWVNSFKSDCGGAPPITYHLQTQEGIDKPEKNWDCFYESIEGFDYEPGYIYQIEVSKSTYEGKPILSLVEIISKERDPKYHKIHDIWALTHINEEVVDITANRPTIEVNLTTNAVLGNALCNQYTTVIKAYTSSRIEFGPIASTKMMCPNIAKEQAYLEALGKVHFYSIHSMTLRFYNEMNEEVLRYQKVD